MKKTGKEGLEDESSPSLGEIFESWDFKVVPASVDGFNPASLISTSTRPLEALKRGTQKRPIKCQHPPYKDAQELLNAKVDLSRYGQECSWLTHNPTLFYYAELISGLQKGRPLSWIDCIEPTPSYKPDHYLESEDPFESGSRLQKMVKERILDQIRANSSKARRMLQSYAKSLGLTELKLSPSEDCVYLQLQDNFHPWLPVLLLEGLYGRYSKNIFLVPQKMIRWVAAEDDLMMVLTGEEFIEDSAEKIATFLKIPLVAMVEAKKEDAAVEAELRVFLKEMPLEMGILAARAV